MIHIGLFVCSGWDEVRRLWKRGERNQPRGFSSTTGDYYHVGEGFVIYPCDIYRAPDDLCKINRGYEPKEERLSYYASNTDCGYLNSF